MKNSKLLLFLALIIFLIPVVSNAEHIDQCSGNHNDCISMTEKATQAYNSGGLFINSSEGWRFAPGENGSLDLSGGNPDINDVMIFPDQCICRDNIYVISTAKQHEGGYAGIHDFMKQKSGTSATVLVIPDSYQTIDFIGFNETLDYVSLPANDNSYELGLKAAYLLRGKGVTWLVVEGSQAHRGLMAAGIHDFFFPG